MRFRTHALAAAVAGALLYPRQPARAALLLAGGVALDIDHQILYALRSGDWSLSGALRYNRYRAQRPHPGDTRPRYGPLRSVAHRPALTLPLTWLMARRWPAFWPFWQGLALHLLLDAPQWLEWDWRVRKRAAGRCERCGSERPLRIHLSRNRRDGGFWSARRRIAICAVCARR